MHSAHKKSSHRICCITLTGRVGSGKTARHANIPKPLAQSKASKNWRNFLPKHTQECQSSRQQVVRALLPPSQVQTIPDGVSPVHLV